MDESAKTPEKTVDKKIQDNTTESALGVSPKGSPQKSRRPIYWILFFLVCFIVGSGVYYKQIRLWKTGESKEFIVKRIRKPNFFFRPTYVIRVEGFAPKVFSVSKRTKEYSPGDTIILLYNERLRVAAFMGDYPKTLANVLRNSEEGSVSLIFLLLIIPLGIAVLAYYNIRASFRAILKRWSEEDTKNIIAKVLNVSLFVFNVLICYVIISFLALILMRAAFTVEQSGVVVIGLVLTSVVLLVRYLPEWMTLGLLKLQTGKEAWAEIVRGLLPVAPASLIALQVISFYQKSQSMAFSDIFQVIGKLVCYIFGGCD